MQTNSFIVKQKDGHQTMVYHYAAHGTVRASLLCLHGMAEHYKRYEEWANYLNENGFDIYLFDHRGHGNNTLIDELGFFGQKDGYNLVITDALNILDETQKRTKGNPLFLMGHSMGSLIVRNIIQYNDKLQGVIICGSTWPSNLTINGGLLISSFIRFFKGPKHRSPFLDKLMFGGKNYRSLSNDTSYDWLTNNKTIVGHYIDDPYCGFLCTSSFYHDLITLAKRAGSPKRMLKTKKELPLFILAGDKDPVGNYGKEVKKLVHFYKENGYTSVSHKLYKDLRHELLNETNNKEVMKDIVNWMKKQL